MHISLFSFRVQFPAYKKTVQTIHLYCLSLQAVQHSQSVIEHHRHEQHEQFFVLGLLSGYEYTGT